MRRAFAISSIAACVFALAALLFDAPVDPFQGDTDTETETGDGAGEVVQVLRTRFAVPDEPPPGVRPVVGVALENRTPVQALPKLIPGRHLQLIAIGPDSGIAAPRNPMTLRLVDEEERVVVERRSDSSGRMSFIGLEKLLYEIEAVDPAVCLLAWGELGAKSLTIQPGIDIDLTDEGDAEGSERVVFVSELHAAAFVVLGDELLCWKRADEGADAWLAQRLRKKIAAVRADFDQRWPHAQKLFTVPRNRDPKSVDIQIEALLARSGIVKRHLRLRRSGEILAPKQFRIDVPSGARSAHLRIDVVDPAGVPKRMSCGELFPRDHEMPAIPITSNRDHDITPGRYVLRPAKKLAAQLPKKLELGTDKPFRRRIKLKRFD